MDTKKISENIARLLNENHIRAEANVYALFPIDYKLNIDKALVWYVSSSIVEIPKLLTNNNIITPIFTTENLKFVITIFEQSEKENPTIDATISQIDTILNGVKFTRLSPMTMLNISALSLTEQNIYYRQIYFNIQYSHQVTIINKELE
jgi:hypothetical protein